MGYLAAYGTDVGNVRETNQDSLCIKIAELGGEEIVFAVICDGMGGLNKGEAASGYVVRCFSDWFDGQLPGFLESHPPEHLVQYWTGMLREQNQRLGEYASRQGIQMGTTATVFLAMGGRYYGVHVGDTRLYCVGTGIACVTKDQTLAAREVERGTIPLQQAEHDKRNNVLLQCVGASQAVEPEILMGSVENDTVFLLCTDGFRHVVTKEEIFHAFHPDSLTSEGEMEQRIRSMIELVKERGETDNISALAIKAV